MSMAKLKFTDAASMTKLKKARSGKSVQLSVQDVAHLLGTSQDNKSYVLVLMMVLYAAMRESTSVDKWCLALGSARQLAVEHGVKDEVIDNTIEVVVGILNEGRKNTIWPEGFI